MRILVVEDDRESAVYVAHGFEELGHTVDIAGTGRDGLFLATGEPYDVIVLDRMLPGLDGLTIVKTLRSAGEKAAILFLTAVDGVDDRVAGLNAGADDYLVKPFSFSELAARVNALARRPAFVGEETVLRAGDLEMDRLKRTVRRGGMPIELQPREFKLLEYLMRNAGHVVTRTMLLEHVWDFHFDPKTKVVETHISRLRTKIDRNYPGSLIHTIRGAGYSLHAEH